MIGCELIEAPMKMETEPKRIEARKISYLFRGLIFQLMGIHLVMSNSGLWYFLHFSTFMVHFS
jgi:hypothetical protein